MGFSVAKGSSIVLDDLRSIVAARCSFRNARDGPRDVVKWDQSRIVMPEPDPLR
jgi:hypothetical protein